MAACTYVSHTENTFNTDPSSLTHNHASGNAVIAVLGERGDGGTLNAVKWGGSGGVAMTLAVSSTVGGRRVWIYYLKDAASGSQALWADWSATPWLAMGAISVSGFGKIGDTDFANGYATSVSKTMDTTVNDLVVDSLACTDASTPTVGGGQTQRWNRGVVSSMWGACSTEPGSAGSTVMSWSTIDAGDTHNYAVAVLQGAVVGGAIWFFFQRQQKFLRDLKAGLIPPRDVRRRHQEVYSI